MPHVLVAGVPLAGLLAMLLVAFAHPRGRVEATVGLVAAAASVAVGAVSPPGAVAELARLLPVVAFLAAILVVAELCAAEGVFRAIGAGLARASGGRPHRMLLLTFLAAAATTATLSLDATVVLLTPVVAAAASSSLLSPRPAVHACVRLANSASLLLPVSNLTNLLAMPSLDLTFLEFTALMAPAWLAVLAVEYVGQRLFFRDELRLRSVADRAASPVPAFPVVVLGLMLVGFAALSPFGVAPAWVAAAAAAVLAVRARRRSRTTLAEVARATHASFAVFVLCLGVVVAALGRGELGDVLHAAVPAGSSLAALLAVAGVAMLLANVVNNLPATLLLLPLVAPSGVLPTLAALVGLNVGSNLTYVGSLANLLWRRTLLRRGMRPSARDFHVLSALVTVPAVAAGVLALWAWSRLL